MTIGEVWPETREQCGWYHKLTKLPKRLQKRSKTMLHEVMYAVAGRGGGRRVPDGVLTPIREGRRMPGQGPEALLSSFDFPAARWVHLRTTNVIESPFGTVRLHQRVTKGTGNRMKALTMAFKLLEMAQQRWRCLNGSHLLPLVRERASGSSTGPPGT